MLEKQFGIILNKYRKGAKLSQSQLADLAGVDRTYISLMERGLRHPTISMLFKISKALGVPPSQLILELEDSNETT